MQTGEITVRKATLPGGGSGFGFTSDIPGEGPFVLDDGGSVTFEVPVGTWTVTEDDPGLLWELATISCGFAGGGDADLDLVTRSAVIEIVDGASVDCTFTNQGVADLQVVKDDGVTGSVTPGETITYTIEYANVGVQPAIGTLLSETVPGHTTFNAAASTPGWVCAPDVNAGSICTLAIGTVNGGDGGEAVFAVDVDDPLGSGVTDIVNTIVIADDGTGKPDPNPGDNTDTTTTAVVVLVEIDVKPGSDPNSIKCNDRNGVITVAILTTAGFDALTVDHATVEFEGATELHRTRGEARRHEEDVDGDGDIDLVLHFKSRTTSLTCSSVQGTLTGHTSDGHNIVGSDAVRMIE